MHPYPTAVIDIGSNSVRIVIYDALKRVPLPLFNEKQSCGLGRDLDTTGKLNPKGVTLAFKALNRFAYLIRIMQVKSVTALATAAVREAEDGAAFVEEIQKRYNFPVYTLPGQEEAQFAALGVLSAIDNVNGMIGDLGGGSLELVSVRDKNISYCQSFPLGVLRLESSADGDGQKIRSEMDSILKAVPFSTHLRGKRFYAVGGSFRTVAKIHIVKTAYPLRVVHNYEVPAEELYTALTEMRKMPKEEIAAIQGISLSRIDTLSVSAILLQRVIEVGKPSHIVFSSHGIREGFLYYQLPEAGQNEDPLISGSYALMRLHMPSPAYFQELMDWMTPLFVHEKASEKRLRLAACILNDLACQEHPEYRAETAFHCVMDSFLTGLDHAARVFIALAVYHRYKASLEDPAESIATRLLSRQEIHRAQVIGYAMRLSRNIAASMPGILPHTRLESKGRKLILWVDKAADGVQGEVVEKRLKQLAALRQQEGEILVRKSH